MYNGKLTPFYPNHLKHVVDVKEGQNDGVVAKKMEVVKLKWQ